MSEIYTFQFGIVFPTPCIYYIISAAQNNSINHLHINATFSSFSFQSGATFISFLFIFFNAILIAFLYRPFHLYPTVIEPVSIRELESNFMPEFSRALLFHLVKAIDANKFRASFDVGSLNLKHFLKCLMSPNTVLAMKITHGIRVKMSALQRRGSSHRAQAFIIPASKS